MNPCFDINQNDQADFMNDEHRKFTSLLIEVLDLWR
jgi:hypothetical protein